jgi:hypothetical protein
MNAADIELARMVYIASGLAALLFTSMILRGLWRPLRFLLIALTISILFTPFFVDQTMPDGSDQNLVPAFVVMAHKVASDRENWRNIVKETSRPIVVVASITGFVALVLAVILPKPKKPPSNKSGNEAQPNRKKKQKKNPYLPDEMQPE